MFYENVERKHLLTLKCQENLHLKMLSMSSADYILANFSNLFFSYRQIVWTLIRLFIEEQYDLGPHCL